MKRDPYKVTARIEALQEILTSEHATLAEAQEVEGHFKDHGHEAEIYKWNSDDQRYLRMK
jgi:hypothetical protein